MTASATPQFPAPVFSGPRIRAAIIDLDGTMIDTADDFTAGLNGMLAQLDAAETSREEVVGYVGKGSEHLVRSVLAPRFEAAHAQDRFDEALAVYQDEEVRQAYQQQLAQAERQSNGSLSDAQRNDIKMRVLDDYVNSEALVTRADKLGYRVTDQQLLQAMAQIPIFQVDGKFDYAHAVAVLRAQGRWIPEIEALFKRDVKFRQLDSALTLSSFATAAEIKQIRALTKQQRELASSWLVCNAPFRWGRWCCSASPI